MIAERDWFPGQVNEWQDNGKLVIRYPSAAEEVIVSWVLSYAGELQLVSPSSAVDKLKEKLRKLSALH